MELVSIGREEFFNIFNKVGDESEHIEFLKSLEFLKSWPIEKFSEQENTCLTHYYK